MLNIRKGIVGGRLSQIVVERCRFGVNHVLAAVFKGKERDHRCQKNLSFASSTSAEGGLGTGGLRGWL